MYGVRKVRASSEDVKTDACAAHGCCLVIWAARGVSLKSSPASSHAHGKRVRVHDHGDLCVREMSGSDFADFFWPPQIFYV